MAEEEFKRRLTAIFSADVEGYSRLMREDEEATVRTITTYRTAMTHLIQQYRGRVVDSPGDNVLAEFTSVVDAVNCGVEIQRELAERNAELPENSRMRFRIGINLGDILEEGDRIYGDGVNIAARMESLAEAGGICISGTVYDAIENKIGLEYEYLGEHEVKNIDKTIRAYRVLSYPGAAAHRVVKAKKAVRKNWRNTMIAIVAVLVVVAAAAVWHFYFRQPSIKPASVEKMAFPLPEKPSIAVLPFNNLSGDPAQDYIADGISENIISALSKISEMFVIASNSTFTYKGKPVKVQQVSEELGVRYVLEGSAQKIGNRVRITAQLIDATTGHHLWSEKYDRDMKDLFDLQDEIAHKIIVELQVKLTEGEQARVSHKSTTNLEAWSYAVRGLKLFEDTSKENNAKAMELFERAVELDPGYVWAWVRLAWTHLVASAVPGWSQSPSESYKKAVEISQKVLVLDESDSDVRALLGNVYLRQNRYEQAITEGEKSLELGPTNAQWHVLLAVSMNVVGRFDDAIELVKKAMRLHPYYPAYYLQWLGAAYRMTGRYEDALIVYKQLLDRSRKGEFSILRAHIYMAEVYIELGREEEARTHAAEVLRISPKFSLERASKLSTYKYKDPAHLERRLSALRKAGLPETPPLPLPDKPSIAVLPFENMSGDPEQEYFSDGITEEIITALSKTPKLFVIARNSTFTYKGKPVKVQQVGRELGVKYVLEGSVRKAGNKVRVTAQLVDTATGHHLWAERYDRDLKDIFALQDEITKGIITALQVKLTMGEEARLLAKGTKNIEAYIKLLQGTEYLLLMNKEGNILARKMAEEVIALDPDYPRAYRLLAMTNWLDAFLRWSNSPGKSLASAEELAQKVLAMDESDSISHRLLGYIYLLKKEHDKAIAGAERAVALDPNASGNLAALGFFLNFAGRPEEAIVWYKKAIRLDPIPAPLYYLQLGHIYRNAGRYEEAISELKKALHRNPDNLLAHLHLAGAYSSLGREEEAQAEAAEVLRIDPKFSLDYWSKTIPYKNKADENRLIGALRKAGLK